MRKRMKKAMLLLLPALFVVQQLWAQCAFHNEAFRSGEYLTYNLYYNWQFIWVKAGTASMHTVLSNYKGKAAYRSSLITRGNNKVDKMFVLRDTLLCYGSLALEPLYFRKGAREGKRYTVDEVSYSYKDGKVILHQHRLQNNGNHLNFTKTLNYCVFDMLNMFMRARSFNPTGWKKGHDIDFPIADGNSIHPAKIRYEGKTNVKGDDGVKYRCLRLSYLEDEGKGFKRIVDFYVTDDANHVPVRLDMFLRFGSAKAFLTSMKGVRHPLKSVVSK